MPCRVVQPANLARRSLSRRRGNKGGDERPRFGRIVRVDVPDSQGAWPGPHYAVILSGNEAIEAGKRIVVAVISDEFRLAKPDQIVLLPYIGRPNGPHPITKLFN